MYVRCSSNCRIEMCTMTTRRIICLAALLLLVVPSSSSLKALLVTIGAAGHVTPMFELAKAMKDHQVTFITHRFAQSYVDIEGIASPSFRIVYTNDSSEALADQKAREQQLLSYVANQSFFDALGEIAPLLGGIILSLVNETAHVLAVERFDVIVGSGMIFAAPYLCEKVRTPCILQKATMMTDSFDFNLPNSFSSLKPEDLTRFQHRIYNVIFNIRLMVKVLPKLIPAVYRLFRSLPQLPEPFSDTLTVNNLFSTKPKYLSLISMPPSFLPPAYPDPYTKFLGSFIDETAGNVPESDLTRWIKSKSADSIVYGAFGSSSLIPHDRMSALINGLATFLKENNDSCALLALRSVNYKTYFSVLNGIEDGHLKDLLNSSPRVRIEPGFVPQKWILQQPSINVFISHCGMGSALESLYFSKPILCMPFNMEQFSNALSIANLGVGLSLFVPPSIWTSLRNPYNYVHYTFPAARVTESMLALWTQSKYKKAATLMSLEMKNAGGVRRAVQEIEFFVQLNGNLDRYAPFQSTLPFHQRWMLDLALIFLILPGCVGLYFVTRCCKRQRKIKRD